MRQRIAEFAIMFFIGFLSLGLLAYVGNREAFTKYPHFEVEKVISQARPVQLTLEKFLNAGLPLAQFAGFDTLVKPIVKVDDAIDAITVINTFGAIVFQQVTPGVATDPIEKVERIDDEYLIVESNTQSQIIIPLKSRFGFGGQLIIHLPRKYITDKINGATRLLPYAAGIGSLILGIYGALALKIAPKKRARLDQLIFVLVFLSASATVIFGLVKLYAEGSQTKTEGFGLALTERLRSVYDMGLRLDDVEGVEAMMETYRNLNPEIQSIALIVDGKVVISSNPQAIGQPFTPDIAAFGVTNQIDGVPGLDSKVYVSLPYDVVLYAVGRTAKTFVVLLVASGFMAGLFFQLGGALRGLQAARRTNTTDGQSAVEAIKPVLFVGFLIENLAASFLPQLMQRSAAASGLSPSLASMMFMAYFVAFALTLVPAGMFADKRGARPLILMGAVLAAGAAAMMALSDNYLIITAARLLSGVGQGLLFIGSQSYILAYAAADKRTQSAGIIVYTFNGGMLSGLVIGGLLSTYLGVAGVFWIAAVAGLIIMAYTWTLIDPSPLAPAKAASATSRPKGSIFGVFRSVGFLWTTFLVGIPAKAVLTGVVFFAMPLLLTGLNLGQEDIGQIIMFYALGVLVSSHFISRYVDRSGNIRWVLFTGMAVSGLGLCVIGSVGWASVQALGLTATMITIVLLAGTFLVGLGHGAINAPVVTHIAASDASQRVGEAQATAFYRFVERLGHVTGPIVVGQLLLYTQQSPSAIAWLGFLTMALATLFVLYRPPAASARGA